MDGGRVNADTKSETWQFRGNRRVEAIQAYIDTRKPYSPYSIQQAGLVSDCLNEAIHESGIPFWKCSGDAERFCALVARLDRASDVYILSNDTDLIAMAGCQFIHFEDFDKDGSIKRAVMNDRDTVSQMTCMVFQSEKVAHGMGFEVKELAELAILCGCDFVKNTSPNMRIGDACRELKRHRIPRRVNLESYSPYSKPDKHEKCLKDSTTTREFYGIDYLSEIEQDDVDEYIRTFRRPETRVKDYTDESGLERTGALWMGVQDTRLGYPMHLGTSVGLPDITVPFANEMFSYHYPLYFHTLDFHPLSMKFEGRMKAEGLYESKEVDMIPSRDTLQLHFKDLRRTRNPDEAVVNAFRKACNWYYLLWDHTCFMRIDNWKKDHSTDMVLRVLVDINCYMDRPSLALLQGGTHREDGFYFAHRISEDELDVALVTIMACRYAQDQYHGHPPYCTTGNHTLCAPPTYADPSPLDALRDACRGALQCWPGCPWNRDDFHVFPSLRGWNLSLWIQESVVIVESLYSVLNFPGEACTCKKKMEVCSLFNPRLFAYLLSLMAERYPSIYVGLSTKPIYEKEGFMCQGSDVIEAFGRVLEMPEIQEKKRRLLCYGGGRLVRRNELP
eukprot:GHVO01051553.1.p1 GENE.GHVO01051553.1~~GHVO01051553.1.p1  ORF type:complete len:698 (+),score=129.87 GHVO01051553.1:244-2094(+)